MHIIESRSILLIFILKVCLLKADSLQETLPTAENVCTKKLNNTTTLKVALYPYLPDSGGDNHKGLLQFITTEFNKLYPDIKLQLRPLNKSDGFYELDVLSKWLMSDGSGQDIVEIDTVILGDLVNIGLINPQFVSIKNQADWHDAAKMAVQINEAIYAFPHLMCTYFLFTRDGQVAATSTIDQLVTVLGSTPSNNYRLVGNLDSSWGLPSLWLDSYQNSVNTSANLVGYALHAYNKDSFENVRKLAGLCYRSQGDNHCLDGTFKNSTNMTISLFRQNQTVGMFDYSEKLFDILKDGNPDDYKNIKMIPLPTGSVHNQAVFYTDAFVFRRNMSADVLNASSLFAEFMGTPRMQAALAGSEDKPGSIPRYLLPISKSAYDDPLLVNDRFYQTYFRNVTGSSCATVGFRNTRKQLQTAILNYIG